MATAESVLPARRERAAVLGQWNSAVASYYLILGTVVLLVAIGLVMVLSSSSVSSLSATDGASPYGVFFNQARFALVGLPLAWLASRLPVAWYKRFAWPVLLVALGLQALVPLIGATVRGNQNWIVVGGQSIQPSEFAKLALALWLGVVLARKRQLLDDWRHVLVPGVAVAVVTIGLVLLGHDLGTALILMILVGGALFVAGVPLRFFAVGMAFAGVVVLQLAQMGTSRMARINVFFSSDCDAQVECYQTMRGLYGLATGGLTGIGLGESREKWSYLPMAHNDFIFAILGEELGLLGTLLVLALFGVLAFALTRVVRRHPDPFVQITTGAIGAWVLGQALVNIAVVVDLLPVVGVPLPLVSAGGSALVTTMVAMGVLLSFARDEPGAARALAARPGVVRRSLAVIGLPRRASHD
jgi:cell division protein FtsW